MQTKLLNWAKETYKIYSALVNKYDIGFYNQTPLGDIKEPVKVVVMGNNPCSEGSFSDMKKNVNWGFDKLGGEEYRHLIRGNFFWQERCTKWSYWYIPMELLSHAYPGIKENEEKECVFTNATFFNALHAEDLKKYKGLYEETLPCTLKLIEILSPEMVLNIVPNNFDRMRDMFGDDFECEAVFNQSLMLGRYKGILFVSIYYPTSEQSTPAYQERVKKALVLIREKRDLSIREKGDFSIKEIASQLKDAYGEEWNK